MATVINAVAEAFTEAQIKSLLPHIEQMVMDIPHSDLRAYAVSALANASAWAGESDQAEKITSKLDSDQLRAVTLVATASAAAARGGHARAARDLAAAVDAARDISARQKKVDALSAIATFTYRNGDQALAQRMLHDAALLRTDWAPIDRTPIKIAFARAAVHAGDFGSADSPPHGTVAPVLCAIAEEAVKVGDLDLACQIADSITDPLYSALAISTVTIARGDHADARRRAATALKHGGIMQVMRDLFRLEPGVASIILRELT